MFENLTKALGIGASFAFLLALAHECILMFALGIDMRIVPYEIGDLATLSAIMLPSILGLQLSIVVYALTLDNHLPRWAFFGGMFLWVGLFVAGFGGQVLLILLTALMIAYLVFQHESIEEITSDLLSYAPSTIAVSVFLIAFHAFADAGRALSSDKLPHAISGSNAERVLVIRSLSKGYIVRDKAGAFSFVGAENFDRIELTAENSEDSP